MHSLREEQKNRYWRNILLEGVGEEGQLALLQSKVLLIGVGGLGSSVALYLAAAGVGRLGIVDSDVVDLSNLQRQIIHSTPDLQCPKVQSAKQKLQALNPDIIIDAYEMLVDSSNILGLLESYDYIIDGTDNFASKFLINAACVLANKPLSHGGVLHFCGQALSILPRQSACLACLFHSPPKTEVPMSSQVGILGSVAGLLGCIQATETIKLITGLSSPLFNQLLTFDVQNMAFNTRHFERNAQCHICGDGLEIDLSHLG